MGGQQYQNPQQPPVPHKTIPAEAGISQSYATNNAKIHPQTYRFPRGPFLRRQESQAQNRQKAIYCDCLLYIRQDSSVIFNRSIKSS